ncbi:hypothetical protein FRC11_010545 [Ceratobasidium sp. 423]|nr:hypothetical protein FRC11_010545 [Ceratobasidium sp. 423]
MVEADKSTGPPPNKRRKVTVEELPDEDTPRQTTPAPTPSKPPGQGSRDSASNHDMRSRGLYCYKGLYAKDFPDPLAGSPISEECASPPDLAAYMRACGPMADPDHFEVAELLLTSGLSNADKDRHLKSKKPWRLYTSASKAERVYADMASADWWWEEMLKLIEQGQRNATIAPLIIAVDQTTLSIMCGGQKAYPVYVSFGNLDKEWRRKPSKRGTYLLGYLPVDTFKDIPDDDERRRLKVELVHCAMEKMLELLREASEQGIEMWCPDGRLRRIYPCIAALTADWPEQNLQCCTLEGGCPICKTAHDDQGKFEDEAELRKCEETLLTLRTYILTKNKYHLKSLGLKGIWPWWGDILDVNLSTCVTPDLLHQAYQGLFKTHLVRWMKKLVGADILDDQFTAMPQAEGLARFTKGLAGISSNQWTGSVSKELLTQFLPAVISSLTPERTQLVRALVDFMYQGHATSLTESDLAQMDDDLRIFHEQKHTLVGPKSVYPSESRFNKIAKLHML